MEKRMLNERDLNKIVKKVLQEGSTWEGVKGWFKGKGYNFSKYLSQINDTLYKIKRRVIEDEKLKEEIDEITKNVEASSAETWQKDELKSLMKELSDTISKTNIKLEKISIRIKKIK